VGRARPQRAVARGRAGLSQRFSKNAHFDLDAVTQREQFEHNMSIAGGEYFEEHEAKLAALRSALERGEQSGEAESYSLDRLLTATEAVG
jgi:hypothetical protein